MSCSADTLVLLPLKCCPCDACNTLFTLYANSVHFALYANSVPFTLCTNSVPFTQCANSIHSALYANSVHFTLYANLVHLTLCANSVHFTLYANSVHQTPLWVCWLFSLSQLTYQLQWLSGGAGERLEATLHSLFSTEKNQNFPRAQAYWFVTHKGSEEYYHPTSCYTPQICFGTSDCNLLMSFNFTDTTKLMNNQNATRG